MLAWEEMEMGCLELTWCMISSGMDVKSSFSNWKSIAPPPPPVFSTSTTLLTVLLAEETSESALLSSESAHSQVGNIGRTYKSTFCFVKKRIMLSCKALVVKRCRQQSQTFHIWWLLQKILRLSGGLSPPTTLPWLPCPNRFYKRDIVCTCLWAVPDAKRSKWIWERAE